MRIADGWIRDAVHADLSAAKQVACLISSGHFNLGEWPRSLQYSVSFKRP